MITHTHTRTHITFAPANPYLACVKCGQRVEAFHDDACGCPESGGPLLLMPCMHRNDYRDTCPSWSPVDGCQCIPHLGYLPHPLQVIM